MTHIAIVDAQGRLEGNAATAVVPWWSFSKTLIAACALPLAKQRRPALDEPLPGLPYTLRQLLQHRVGLGDYGSQPAYRATVARGDAPWMSFSPACRRPSFSRPVRAGPTPMSAISSRAERSNGSTAQV